MVAQLVYAPSGGSANFAAAFIDEQLVLVLRDSIDNTNRLTSKTSIYRVDELLSNVDLLFIDELVHRRCVIDNFR